MSGNLSPFAYMGATRMLNSATVKPMALARLFGIDLSTLVITNRDTGELHLPNGDLFDPSLPVSGTYDVEGAKQASASSAFSDSAVATQSSSNELVPISKQEKWIDSVIKESNSMNEGAIMLHHAPQAVILVESLAVLAACTIDVSLVSGDYPASKFKRLTCPGSFKASLYEVASHICNAFRTADSSMNKIKMTLIDMPDYFENALDAATNPDDPAAQRTLKSTLSLVKQASQTCTTAAERCASDFKEVIYDIDELVQAATSSKKTNEDRLSENAKAQDDYKTQLELREQQAKIYEEEYKAKKEFVEKSCKELDKAMAEMQNTGKLFAMAFTDFFLDTLHSTGDAVKGAISSANPANMLGRVTNMINLADANISNSKEFLQAAEAGLVSVLDNVQEALDNPDTLPNNCDELLGSLNMAVKFAGKSETSKAAIQQAKELIKFLPDVKAKKATAAEIAKVKGGLASILKILAQAEQQKEQERRRKEERIDKTRESIVQVKTKHLDATREIYYKAEEDKDKLRKELLQNQREMADFAGKLARLNLEKVELDGVLKYLVEGVDILSRVKESWEHISKFFQCIHDVVSGPLAINVDNFVENANSGTALTSHLTKKMLLQSTVKACGLCSQITACADIYAEVSGKHVMPVIAAVGKNLSLTRGQAQVKQSQIEQRMHQAQADVETLIEDRIRQSKETIETMVKERAQTYTRSLTHK